MGSVIVGLLIAGVAIFSLLHLFPAAMNAARDRCVSRIGEQPYRGVFALLVLGSVIMIVFGWKSAVPQPVYVPLLAAGIVPSGLVLAAFVLFVAAQRPTNIKRVVRHPQLTGVAVWAAAHLLSNGDTRSVVLFGGLGAWALIEIVFCNRRDGRREKPQRVSFASDAAVTIAGAIAFAVFAYFHSWLFGVSVVPGV